MTKKCPLTFNKDKKVPNRRALYKNLIINSMMSDSDLESDIEVEDTAQSLEYLVLYDYQSKADIIFAVAEYHKTIGRTFVITQSDKRRYYVKCAHENCEFYVNYNFPGEAFSKPSSGKVHTCSIFDVSVNRKDSVNNVVRNPSVKQWFDTESRNATTASLDRFLKGIGIDIPYRSVLRTLEKRQLCLRNRAVPFIGQLCPGVE